MLFVGITHRDVEVAAIPYSPLALRNAYVREQLIMLGSMMYMLPNHRADVRPCPYVKVYQLKASSHLSDAEAQHCEYFADMLLQNVAVGKEA